LIIDISPVRSEKIADKNLFNMNDSNSGIVVLVKIILANRTKLLKIIF